MGRTINNRSGVSNLCGCYIPLFIYSILSGVSTGAYSYLFSNYRNDSRKWIRLYHLKGRVCIPTELGVSKRMREILTFGWWIYVLVMMIPQIFIWEGVDMLFIKFFVTVVMLAIPMIFWND